MLVSEMADCLAVFRMTYSPSLDVVFLSCSRLLLFSSKLSELFLASVAGGSIASVTGGTSSDEVVAGSASLGEDEASLLVVSAEVATSGLLVGGDAALTLSPDVMTDWYLLGRPRARLLLSSPGDPMSI